MEFKIHQKPVTEIIYDSTHDIQNWLSSNKNKQNFFSANEKIFKKLKKHMYLLHIYESRSKTLRRYT